MSKKDLFDRAIRGKASRRRPSRTASNTPKAAATESAESGTETRVGRRVIRRRSRTSTEAPTPSRTAATGRGVVRRSSNAPSTTSSRRTVVRRPAKPAAEAPAVQAKAKAPATPAPVPPTVEPTAPATPEVVPAAEVAPAPAPAEAAPAAQAEAVAPAAQAEAAAPAAEAEAAAPAAATEAPADNAQAAQAADATAAAEVAAPAEAPAAVQAPEAETPTVESTPAAAEASPAPEPAAAEAQPAADAEPATKSASSRLARSLPRADGSKPAGPKKGRHFPGLGSAVVRPPPGYDPDDPSGNRQRAQAAARQAQAARQRTRPAAAGGAAGSRGTPGSQWRDQRPGAAKSGAGKTDYSKRKGAERARPAKRRRRRGYGAAGMDDRFRPRRPRRKKRTGPKKVSPKAKAIKRRVEVSGTITVSQLAHGMSVKAGQVIRTLMGMGQMATANDALDFDTAELVAQEFDYEAINAAFQEDALMIDVADAEEDLEGRPPVVTIMGHVDHGKTTLLDSIRNANVASGEAGGITQHISSYQVTHNGGPITFIDTPGHAAFTAMRARGAQVTDIVVLVVAADDGVMPQTIEVINHAKAADVQIIVAVNKCDKPEAQPQRVRQQLLEYGLVSEDFGGEVIFADVSAITGQGIPELLESIQLVAEVEDYKANPDRHAEGSVIEARLERGRGPVSVVLIQHGTLKRGDHFVVGTTWGRVRAMLDHRGKKLKTAGPSTPVEIMGLQDVPVAGDNFVVVGSDKDAKALAQHRIEEARQKSLATGSKRMTLEELLQRGGQDEILKLNLILKSDVGGSLEALKGSIDNIEVDGTDIRILHSAVGAVSESDVTLAHTNQAVVIAFNVRPDANARRVMDGLGVEVRTYKVIYEALEDIEKALKGLLGPDIQEVVQGTAEIRQTFAVPKVGTIAGCMVTMGSIARSHQIRLIRQGKIVWEGRLGSLRRFKDDVRKVENGYECGMNLDGFNDIKVGDVIESFTNEEVEATA